jgi:hypothetical protein
MKAPLGIALMVLVASAPTTFAQLPDPRPDLVIAGIVTSKQRVGVDETFYHAVTDRNAGRTPCNFVNLTLKLPGEVDLDGASSESPPWRAPGKGKRMRPDPRSQRHEGRVQRP